MIVIISWKGKNVCVCVCVYLWPPRTPAFMVSWSMMAADLGSTLDAFAYCMLSPSPDGTKNAPFTNMSPSVLQFHPAHSSSLVSTRFVTCCKQTNQFLKLSKTCSNQRLINLFNYMVIVTLAKKTFIKKWPWKKAQEILFIASWWRKST